jgi:flagellin-like hook-associated protein FlgL
LDRARESLLSKLSAVGLELSKFDQQYESESSAQQSLTDAREELTSADLATSTSELTAAQIRQQAQIAALTQSRISQRTALALLY